MREPPGINTVANEQTEPEELKENKGGTDGQAWGKVAFSCNPHLCPGLRGLCLGPKARTSLAHTLGEVEPISLPTPGLMAKRLGRSSNRATFKSPLTSGWVRAPSSEGRMGMMPVFIMGIWRELRFPNDLGPSDLGAKDF